MLGRLEPIDPAVVGWQTDRADHVGADLDRRHARRDGSGRSAARTARIARGVPRVAGPTEDRVRALEEVAESGRHVRVADDVGAGGAQSRSDSAILDRDPIENGQADGRSQPSNVVRILEGHRDAVQRTQGVATSEGGVGGFRLSSGPTLVERHDGIERRIELPDSLEVGFEGLDGSQSSEPDPRRELHRAQLPGFRRQSSPNQSTSAPTGSPPLVRHRSGRWQAEGPEQPGAKRRDLCDEAAFDAQDIELERPELGVARPTKIARRGRHSVGPSRHETPLAVPKGPPEQGRDRVEPIEPHQVRRHRDSDVLGGDRQGSRGVTTLVGIDEPGEQGPLLLGRHARGPLCAPCRQVRLHRRPSPLERAVRRGDARLEQGCRLAGPPAQHVAGDQRGALSRWQELQGCQKRELDRLPLDDHRVRLLGARGYLVEQRVRIRLEPRHFGKRVHRRQPPRAASDRIQADVRRDAVEPRSDEGAALEAVAAAPRAQERLLHGVFGLIERGQHPIAVDMQLAPVALRHGRKCRPFSGWGRVRVPGFLPRCGHRAWCLTSWTSQPFPSGSLSERNVP
jgi:hypothetical protein